jgi:hypothetical protein
MLNFLLRRDALRTTNSLDACSSTGSRSGPSRRTHYRPQQPHFLTRQPSHKAWLLCNIRKCRDFSTLRSALLPTEQETFPGSAQLAGVTPGWRAHVCLLMPVIGADLASLRMKIRPSERVGIGRWDRG